MESSIISRIKWIAVLVTIFSFVSIVVSSVSIVTWQYSSYERVSDLHISDDILVAKTSNGTSIRTFNYVSKKNISFKKVYVSKDGHFFPTKDDVHYAVVSELKILILAIVIIMVSIFILLSEIIINWFYKPKPVNPNQLVVKL